jgi:Fic family protein
MVKSCRTNNFWAERQDILDRLPNTSVSTVEAALTMLLKEGFITKEGAGKRTSYIKT